MKVKERGREGESERGGEKTEWCGEKEKEIWHEKEGEGGKKREVGKREKGAKDRKREKEFERKKLFLKNVYSQLDGFF